jgi:hypothetical protein
MPSSVDRPVGEPSVAFCINLTELGSTLMGAGFFFLWFYCVFSSTLALPTALGHVHALRASGAYNPVPGWLGPGAWLAYWLTTLTALARAARALFSERTLATESTEPDADEAWDPDLTASALFTLFASVALLGDSRARADIEPNLLVLCAESLAVLAGVCTGYLGSGFWLGVLLDSPPREVRLSAPGPLVRTALRRIATYSVLLVGSASVLLVFSLRMSSSALLTAARERGSRAVLVYDTLGSIARLAVYLLLEFAFRMAAVAAIFASGTSQCPRTVRPSPSPALKDAPRQSDAPGHFRLRRPVHPKHLVARLGPARHGHPGHPVFPELGRLDLGAGSACAARHSGPRRSRPGVLSHASEPGTRRGASCRTSWTSVTNLGQSCDCCRNHNSRSPSSTP